MLIHTNQDTNVPTIFKILHSRSLPHEITVSDSSITYCIAAFTGDWPRFFMLLSYTCPSTLHIAYILTVSFSLNIDTSLVSMV